MIVWLFVFFFAFWAWQIYRKYGVNVSLYILAIYLFSGICCIGLFVFYPDSIRYPGRVTAWPIILLIGMLWLCLYPLVRFGNSFSIEALTVNQRQLDRFSWCIVVPALASMAVSASMLSVVFAYGDFLKARTAFEDGAFNNLIIEKFGVIGYLVALGPALSIIATILAFYYFFYLKRKGLLTWLLFLASLCIVVNNLAIAGREGMVRWFMFVVLAGVIFRKYLSFRDNKKFWLIVGCAAVVVFGIFMKITIDRFTQKSTDRGAVYSLLYYIGEQPYYFAYNYERFAEDGMTGSLGTLFPSVSGEKFGIYQLNERYYADYFLNIFPYIVGDFVSRAGLVNAIFLCLLIFFGCYFVFWKLRPDQPMSLAKLVGFLFYYEIMLLGVFYFLHSARFTQYTIAFYILLAWYFSRCSRGNEDVGLLEIPDEEAEEQPTDVQKENSEVYN